MKLAQTEVYEVASFYHHFDIVKEGADGRVPAPPALTVRVCDGLSCEMAGAQDLLARLPALLGAEMRVIPAPVRRPLRAGAGGGGAPATPCRSATPDAVQALVKARAIRACARAYVDLAAYTAQGGYALLRECVEGRRDVESGDQDARRLRAARPGRRGLSRPAASGASCATSRRRG